MHRVREKMKRSGTDDFRKQNGEREETRPEEGTQQQKRSIFSETKLFGLPAAVTSQHRDDPSLTACLSVAKYSDLYFLRAEEKKASHALETFLVTFRLRKRQQAATLV